MTKFCQVIAECTLPIQFYCRFSVDLKMCHNMKNNLYCKPLANCHHFTNSQLLYSRVIAMASKNIFASSVAFILAPEELLKNWSEKFYCLVQFLCAKGL